MHLLFQWLMAWTVVTTSTLWVVVVGGLFQPSQDWAIFGLRGAGVGGDFWVVILLALFNGIMLGLGWHGKSAPFHLMLLLWHGTIAAVAASLWFRGGLDGTSSLGFGLEIPLAIPALALTAFATLTTIWVALDLRRGTGSMPTIRRAGTEWWVVTVLALLVAELALFQLSEPGGIGQRVGVLLVATQWILFQYLVLRPWVSPAALEPSAPQHHRHSKDHPAEVESSSR